MKYYVLRLIPPRPTFIQDITEVERALMQRHLAYWSEQMARGRVLIFGPVADPNGPYGICIIKLEDGEDPLVIGNADPVVSANAGFSFYVAPMIRAIVPTSDS
jgi:uncharacterized protein YciI